MDNIITWYFIKKYLPLDMKSHLLDAGAGTGYWSWRLLHLGYPNITLTDISQNMLEVAKKKVYGGGCRFVKSDIRDMNQFREETFDFIISQFDPVSYCLKPDLAISELSRIAKEGAYISVSVSSKFGRVPHLIADRKFNDVKSMLQNNVSHDWGHPQYNFTWQQLEQLFIDNRLEVVEIVGAPIFTTHVDKAKIGKFSREDWHRCIKIELENCTNRTLVNFASHIQIIGKKQATFDTLDMEELILEEKAYR